MTAREELASGLKELQTRSGLSYRAIANGQIPLASLSEALNGRRVPSRTAFEHILARLSATPDEMERLRLLRSKALIEIEQDRRGPANAVLEPRYVVNGGQVTIQHAPPPDPVPQYGRPNPLQVTSPADFVAALNAVHIWAGKPTLRKLVAAGNGILKRSTVSDMLNGDKVPSLDRCTAFLRACGITDVEDWVYTWRHLKALEQPHTAPWLPGAHS
ncbi:hypothetical protein [Streptomyces sp. NPDC089799]|uniref:hypothetical protein n=1 Tax=Streptomyces sp. NPDC089799 TaxID=3155066 RepID=UPI0034203A37